MDSLEIGYPEEIKTLQDEISRLTAEVERLTAERNALIPAAAQPYPLNYDAVCDANESLRTERDALRAALREAETHWYNEGKRVGKKAALKTTD